MDKILLADLNARLDAASDLDPRIGRLVFAALRGELAACLAGAEPTPPEPEADPALEPCRAYVRSIAVEGFRGVGPRTCLELSAGPGLSLIVGRNGSGKSSFAEALELLLTGDNQRWSTRRHKVWKDGWRNLHHTPASIEAEILIEGTDGPTRIERVWSSSELEDATTRLHRGDHTGELAELGWQESLGAYRPFLSYNELGSMLEEGPSRLYDALASILGLEDLVVAGRILADERKAREAEHKKVKAELAELRTLLEALNDERGSQCLDWLKGKKWKLDEIESLITGEGLVADAEVERLGQLSELAGPDPDEAESAVAEFRAAERELDRVRGTDAEKARRLARLLEEALRYHDHAGDGDCPLCGNTGAFDPAWHEQTRASVSELRADADAAELAHRRLAEAERASRALLRAPPPILEAARERLESVSLALAVWDDWLKLREEPKEAFLDGLPKRVRPLAAALGKVRDEAAASLETLQDAWRSAAVRVAAWLPGARRMKAEEAAVKELRAAEKWLKQATTDLRNDRFQPIKQEVLDHWRSLRAKSNVELSDVTFEGTATRRRINLDVTVDGIEGAALGVMSQGELHALALSLFLPRATLEISPFRFLVIDDPVQAMDPARVDGLARTLESVARDRQVMVFTHDDRLPEAIRRLQISADILEIQRRAGSVVEIRRVLGPVERYLDDARSLVRTVELPREVAERVVPGLCRQSLEAAALQVVRRRRLAAGEGHAALEQLWNGFPRLLSRLALALFDDPARAGDVLRALNQRFGAWAGDVVVACNKGAHGALPGDDTISFVRSAERLAHALEDVT